MEMKTVASQIKNIFSISDMHDLSNAIQEKIINDELGLSKEYIFDEYLKVLPDLSDDFMRPIWQFFCSDRKDKKQDYTPKSLAKLVAAITDVEDSEGWCYDCCAGSGSLTIQKWNISPNMKFWCEELDEKVIPILIFNLAVRNIQGYVVNKNVLTGQIYACYRLSKHNKYSKIEVIESKCLPKIQFDCAISNPPFNIYWEPSLGSEKRLANYEFVASCQKLIKDDGSAAIILPAGAIENKNECKERESLLPHIKSIIMCPGNMFESTPVKTCVVFLRNNSRSIDLIDCSDKYDVIERVQKGELHTQNRVYTKKLAVISDSVIKDVKNVIEESKNIPGFCVSVTKLDIKDNCSLTPKKYIQYDNPEAMQHRPFAEIVKDLNKIISERNKVKLTINENLARSIGLSKENFENTIDFKAVNELLRNLCGEEILKDCYISFSKNKNEVKFENKDKDSVSSVLRMTIPVWKHHIFYLNEQENLLLAELRDALLPELMSGKIQLSLN